MFDLSQPPIRYMNFLHRTKFIWEFVTAVTVVIAGVWTLGTLQKFECLSVCKLMSKNFWPHWQVIISISMTTGDNNNIHDELVIAEAGLQMKQPSEPVPPEALIKHYEIWNSNSAGTTDLHSTRDKALRMDWLHLLNWRGIGLQTNWPSAPHTKWPWMEWASEPPP